MRICYNYKMLYKFIYTVKVYAVVLIWLIILEKKILYIAFVIICRYEHKFDKLYKIKCTLQ